MTKRIFYVTLAIATMLGGASIGENFGLPGISGPVTEAQARVGRPLTPVSVAGVARRTVRRCAVGVYYC